MSLERDFSKNLAADLRKETADKIRSARGQADTFKELKRMKEIPKDYNNFSSDFNEKITAAKKNIFGNIFKTEEYQELVAEIEQSLKIKKESDINRIKKDYQQKFEEILGNCPLSEAEREKYLSTEALEKMSLDDYLFLLKRLSGEAFYHVTRYGVRENTFSSTGGGHTVGEGSFLDSFTSLLKDRKINSFFSTVVKNPEMINYYVDSKEVSELKASGKTAEEMVDYIMTSLQTSYFLDRESAHFSYGKPLHNMYGAENDYKFYFYYPVEYILQNDFVYKSRESINIGHGYLSNRTGIDQQYNDFEIFNFGEGVSVNAGILCITGDIQVDPETGSQYIIKDGKPEADSDGNFLKPAKTINSQKYWESYFAKNPEIKPNKILYHNFGTSSYSPNDNLKELDKKNSFRNISEEELTSLMEYEKLAQDKLREMFQKAVQEKFE